MTSKPNQYEALAEQIEAFLKDPDTSASRVTDKRTRRRLLEGGRKLSIALEEPRETMRRAGYSHLQLPLSLIGIESGLFAALSASPAALSCDELVEKTGMAIGLLKRLLRFYQATDVLCQTGVDQFRATNVTRALANNDQANSIRWTHKITAHGGLNLPDWLRENQYQDPVGVLPTAWTSAMKLEEGKHPYQYLAENQWALELAQAHMRIQREGRPLFLDALNFPTRFGQNTTSSDILFVDVGGSTGAQSMNFRKRYPYLPGRVIVQDRPEVVEQAKEHIPSSANIEAEVYDIFMPQPIIGARAYYMRNIFHAWGHHTCLQILAQAKKGLTDQSVLLIDEIVLPEQGATVQGAEHDMEVMICVGGIERTKDQWASLLDEAGLKLHEVLKYDMDYEDSIIIAGLP